MRFITNFKRDKRLIYEKAAQNSGVSYAICDNATDVYGHPLPDYLAFHSADDELSEFWKEIRKLDVQHG